MPVLPKVQTPRYSLGESNIALPTDLWDKIIAFTGPSPAQQRAEPIASGAAPNHMRGNDLLATVSAIAQTSRGGRGLAASAAAPHVMSMPSHRTYDKMQQQAIQMALLMIEDPALQPFAQRQVFD